MKQVVPFTPSAGVLEWVNGTLPLGEYLTGRSVNLSFYNHQISSSSYYIEICQLSVREVVGPMDAMV